jgi:hypothetical protein
VEGVVSELEVQKFLRAGGTLDDLLTKYAIKARRHGEHSNLVLLKYNQIESPFSERIVQECRGIILDESQDWRVVSRAFDKFFNHGEGHAAQIDWSTAQVQEKVDGSLCVLYPYGGEWHVATSGTPDGCGDVHMSGERFSDLFHRAVAELDGELPIPNNRCYFFELTSPLNRIVVPHATLGLTLLGAREIDTQEQVSAEMAVNDFGTWLRAVRSFPLQSFEDIAASFAGMNPLAQEGYVVVDGNFNRVKAKHPGYVALHHAKDGLSLKSFVEIARSGETSEVLTAFPEFAPMVEDAKLRVERLVSYLEGAYDSIKDIEVQKDFALRATKTKCSSPLFLLRAGKVSSLRRAVADMQMDRLMDLLGYGAKEASPVVVAE